MKSLVSAYILLTLSFASCSQEVPVNASTSLAANPLLVTQILSGTSLTLSPSTNSCYSSVTVNAGIDFTSGNICSGKTILGIGGAAFCSLAPDFSNVFRTVGTTQLTQIAET